MNNITEIKKQLDGFYQEYKDNKNTLNGGKTKEVSKLIVDIVSSKDGSPRDAAIELARFSADVSSIVFEKITKEKTVPFSIMEDVLNELLATDTDAKLSQYYVSKFAPAIISIIRCYRDEAVQSHILPQMVEFMARFAIKSDKSKNKFYNLINNTAGEIFKLNYSIESKKSLINIWNAINNIYPDLTKAKYESLISEWGKKNGFIKDVTVAFTDKQDNSIKAEEAIISSEEPVETAKLKQNIATDARPKTPDSTANSETATSSSDNKDNKKTTSGPNGSVTLDDTIMKETVEKKTRSSATPVSDKESPSEKVARKLYSSVKRDMDKEQETIIKAFTDMITPIGKAFESIQGEINKSREIGVENVSLKAKVIELEQQLSEQRVRLQTANQSLMAARTENDNLKMQVSSLESQNSELDSKLNDAYTINSRESSLEAEKIRAELKKAFAYEDWLEYEYSDVSEENYESLQAIIKKIFRSLERNGIDFTRND